MPRLTNLGIYGTARKQRGLKLDPDDLIFRRDPTWSIGVCKARGAHLIQSR